MAKRKRSRGLGGVASTPTSLKAQAKACGSHYFDKDTMRFFNSKLVGVYPVAEKNMTYFVESKSGGTRFPSVPRHYAIGVFKGCRVQGLGKQAAGSGKAAYKTATAARKVAKALAQKASGGGAALKRKRRARR